MLTQYPPGGRYDFANRDSEGPIALAQLLTKKSRAKKPTLIKVWIDSQSRLIKDTPQSLKRSITLVLRVSRPLEIC